VSLASLFSEVRVLTRDGVVPAPLIDAMSVRLETTKLPLQATSVAAMALLAAARGQHEHARELFESVLWFDRSVITADVCECTFGWLITDAASHGDWRRVRHLLREAGHAEVFSDAAKPYVRVEPLAPDTVLTRFFAQLAGKVLGGAAEEQAPQAQEDDRFRLPAEAQRFLSTFVATSASAPTLVLPTEPVAAALQALLVSEGALTETLEDVAALLGEALRSPRVRQRLFERATLLGGGDPDEALAELRDLGAETLGRSLQELRHVKEPLLRELADTHRRALIDEVETRLDRLTDLCEAGTAPPMPEVWREFVAIRRRFERAVALSEPEDRGWPHQVALRLTRYFGTWLRLTKKQRVFAHAVFTFLEVEAVRAGDEKAAQLARASCELCLPFTS
jgi:hypothetical protein